MTVCPIVMHTLKTAAESIAQPHNAVVVTLDPWRDTPRSLPSLAEKWKLPPGAQLLSGSVKDVLGMLAAYKAGASRDAKTGEISHPPLFYVVDAEGTLRYALLNPSAQALTDAVHRVTGSTVATVR
jgi:cytochrome oxidase Cu insertion factor (SCO1/SenC/PrrC family)